MNTNIRNIKGKPKKDKRIKNIRFENINKIKSVKTTYMPEFNSNKTIKNYIKTKLNYNYNNNKTKKIVKNGKNKNNNDLIHTKNNTIVNGGNYQFNEPKNIVKNNFNTYEVNKKSNKLKRKNKSCININNQMLVNSIENDNNNDVMYSRNGNDFIIIIHRNKNLFNKVKTSLKKDKCKNFINNEKNKNSFKKENNLFNFQLHKTSSNFLKENDIYNEIKTIEKYKSNNGCSNKDKKHLSQDRIITKNYLTQKKSNKKINNGEKLKTFNKKMNLNKNNTFSEKKIIKTEQNSINAEKSKYYFDPIIKNLFNNANKIEKQLSKNKRDYSNTRLYSPVDSYKTKGMPANNNTNIIKCGHHFKGKYLSEYKNQINEKPNSS